MTTLMRLGPVFQRVDSAIQRINRSPVNKCQPNLFCAIHEIEIYQVDSVFAGLV